MTDRIGRRHFFQWMTAVCGIVVAGRSVLSPGRALAAQELRRTPSGDRLETVPKGELPSFAKTAGPKVQEAYRYAADNGQTLQYMPCFCGCKNIGHRHNGDCYVTERHSDGRITFNSHAVG